MRVKLGSVAFLKAAGSGYGIGLDDQGHLIEFLSVLAQYHLHPERKFHSGDYLDAGPTSRRHVRLLGPINNIGKEANRWEEQFYLGADPEAQVDYGVTELELDRYAAEVRGRARGFGVREISREASVSVGTVSGFLRGKTATSVRILRGIDRATQGLRIRLPQRPTPGDLDGHGQGGRPLPIRGQEIPTRE